MAFDERMLRWPAAFADSQILDSHRGAPVEHPWHGTVARSTRFEPAPAQPDVPDRLRWVVEACEPAYAWLMRHCARFGERDAAGSAASHICH